MRSAISALPWTTLGAISLLHQAMCEQGRHAVVRVVLSGRERLVLLRPMRRLLAMSTLVYAAQVKAAEGFEEAVTGTELSTEELGLATSLDMGVDVNHQHEHGYMALHAARVHGHSDLVEHLIKRGALWTRESRAASAAIRVVSRADLQDRPNLGEIGYDGKGARCNKVVLIQSS